MGFTTLGGPVAAATGKTSTYRLAVVWSVTVLVIPLYSGDSPCDSLSVLAQILDSWHPCKEPVKEVAMSVLDVELRADFEGY